ncbi:MAG: T9SS type A sorting domain-containing protein [Crocinitomicaceae bacterium]|nr:T9SS type A sorting domain-containing protein [Crocinitomicaceae bacterium]
MKNITIPEPCSEDWNKMSRTEKGAFCKKCAIDVYDFTGKSSNEIKEILALNIGNRVCGHIGKSQLEQLNYDFSIWQMNDKQSFQRAWVFTLFVVFGLTLFSCECDEEPIVGELQRTGQEILENTEIPDSLEIETVSDKVHDQPTNNSKEAELKTINRELDFVPMVNGQVCIEEEPQALQLIEKVEDYEVLIDGGMMTSYEFDEYIVNTTDHLDAVESTPEPSITALVYPNPASNQTTIQVNMPKRAKAEIELFALNGQKIRTIHSGRIKKGESEYPIDISDLQTGMYLVVVYSDKMKETIKFTKI